MAILTPILREPKFPSDQRVTKSEENWKSVRDRVALFGAQTLNTAGSNIAYVCLIGIDFNTQSFDKRFLGLTTLVLKDCTAVSVEKIRQIALQFPNLVHLAFDHCSIESRGVQEICDFAAYRPDLKRLALSYCGVTDEGLASLSKLKELKYLNLRGSLLTDQSLQKVGELLNLKYLDIRDCPGLTLEGVEALQRARVDLNIRYMDGELNPRKIALPMIQVLFSGK